MAVKPIKEKGVQWITILEGNTEHTVYFKSKNIRKLIKQQRSNLEKEKNLHD